MANACDRAFRRLAALTDYETMATVPYHERTYGLARIEALLRSLGNPCARRPVIQVVGSKGKGTTTTAVAAILKAAGLRAGAYLSPHLVHPSERILLDGRPVPGPVFARAVDRVLPRALRLAGGDRPTFFELMTAVALLVFEEEGCDAVVLEAGMGGRLDATTAPRRSAVLLTSISLDHTGQLGRTTALIAAEKASTARRGVPFYSAVPPDSPAGRTVGRRSRRAGAPLHLAGRDWRVNRARTRLGPETTFDLHLRDHPPMTGLYLPMLGAHQAVNAGLAAAALLDLGLADGDAVRRGLAATRVPGRLEVLRRSPLVIVDGAHNGASVRAAVKAVRAVMDPRGTVRVVFAANRDKDLAGMVRALAAFDRVRFVVTEVPALAHLVLRERVAATSARSPAAAHRAALHESGPRDTVLVTGSMYLAGAVRPLLVRG
jgi:dihydrofolate synthase/folylpolyglutamate synthase